MESKIRFGILCSGMDIEKWQEKAVLKLLEIEGVEPALIILNGEDNEREYKNLKLNELLSPHLIYRVYYGLIKNKFKSKEKVVMSSTFSGIPRMVCRLINNDEYSQKFSNADIETIADYKLDFILGFGSSDLRGGILNAARYGIWSFHHDDGQKYRGGPPCFWEIYRNDRITGATLQRLTEKPDEGIILNRGYFPTINHSYVENLDRTFFSSAEWPAKICRGIIGGSNKPVNNPPSKTNGRLYKLPNNLQMIRFLFRITLNCFKFIYRYLFRNDEWNIGVIDKPIQSVLYQKLEPRWLPRPSKGTFLADPFGKSVNGKTYVMVEDLDYHKGRANIAAMEISELDIKDYKKRGAVSLPCHMSYPYIIDYNNEIYLIPETYENRKVVLLKAVDFPNEWEEAATLIQNFAAVDSTVFYHNDYWWLICTNRDTDSNSDLYIWYSKDLFGPWKQHSANPVKTDIKSSRPGGTPFVYNGELYRPAQNSVNTYGGSLVINKVTKLTVSEFEEQEILEIKPDKKSLYNKGIHTLSSMGDKTVVDGKRFVFIPDLLLNRCLRVIKRINVPKLIPKLNK